MAEPSAVEQAVALLTARRAEACERVAALTTEIISIDGALTALGAVASNPPITAAGRAVLSEQHAADGAATPSVRASVRAILEAEDRAFTPAEIRERLPESVMAGKTSGQRTNSVRTALWSLRQGGEAVMVDDTHTKSTKWTPTAPAELPTLDGSESTLAFTEART